MIRQTTLAALSGALLLAACSGGDPDRSSQSGLLADVRAERARDAQSAQLPQLSRALIDNLTIPSLEVVAENRGRTAYLVPLDRRSDAEPGRVTVWRTGDGAQVALRNGVLTATRGLGNDVASSDVAASVRRVPGARTLYLRSDLGDQRAMTLHCRPADLGTARVDIVGKSYPVRHIRETCDHPTGTAVNDYWIEPDGTMRQSRQWAGPDLGYLSMRLLKR